MQNSSNYCEHVAFVNIVRLPRKMLSDAALVFHLITRTLVLKGLSFGLISGEIFLVAFNNGAGHPSAIYSAGDLVPN